MCAKLLDYQFPVKIRSDILKYGIGSIRETDGYDYLRTADDSVTSRRSAFCLQPNSAMDLPSLEK